MTEIDLFISHSTQDDAIVSQIHDLLEASGINVWVDHEDGINASNNWAKEIDLAVNSCQAGLLVMSNESVASDYVRAEWQRILARGLILYTVMIDTIPLEEMPIILSTIQYIDLRTEFDTGINGLIKAVKGKNRLENTDVPKTSVLSITGTFPRSYLDIPLIGRDKDLSEIQRDLGDNRMVSILGLGGLGKTRLAVEIAVKTTFRDGIIWHTISPYSTITELTASIREHLKLDESYNDGAVWRELAHKQVLIVLDNAEDCKDRPAYAQAIKQVDISGGSRILMTSRYQWREVKSKAKNLPHLDEASATAVFEEMLKLDNPAYPIEDYTRQIVIASRFHPRLMEYSVSWLNSYPADYVLEILQSLEGGDAQEALSDIVQKTVDQVREQEGGETALIALRKLGVCRGGFTFEAGRAIIEDVRALALLKQWNLIDLQDSRYRIDPMVTQVVGVDDSAHPAHFDYYKQLAQTHDKAQDYAGLDIESANLDIAFDWQLENDTEEAYWLANACYNFLLNRGRIRKNIYWLERIEPLLVDSTNKALISAFHNSIGIAYRNLASLENKEHNLHKAIEAYDEALKYYTETSAPLDYAMTQNNLGLAYSDLASLENTGDNLQKAIEAYNKALIYRTETAAPLDYAQTQNNLGNAYKDLAKIKNKEHTLHQAIQAYNEALKYRTESSAPLDYAMTQNNLGIAYRNLAEVENKEHNLHQAIQAYKKALKYSTETSAPLDYAMTQNNLGIAYWNLAEIENKEHNLHQAIQAYNHALTYYTETSAPLQYAMTQNNLGTAYLDLASLENTSDNLRKAIEAYSKAIRIEPIASRHYWRGETYILLERYEEALADMDNALEFLPNHPQILEKRKEILGLLGRDE
ncbi:MAG: hypothetical protein Phog2KO_40820 [Phototrophicaceae bacterium]